ncbi:EamA family transporter RarD [Nocardioides sp. B-3]|uniref:EamA family transporter RarD n=1 Tax=Nocardioides sp. B-3 TaxID=2895565 RepID=UPI002152AC8B|nr:EamA family transporter RarD [Nocardioides sp. B-3]UUZ60735.1 EamA family transporter RarD [Nocardioides sp. B-3]
MEIPAHRIVWSALTMAVPVVALRHAAAVGAVLRNRRQLTLLSLAAVVISVNWATYIYGVNNERVVEAALGYFINPLVTVLMGVFILGERLRRLQWIALGIASPAVVVLTIDYGRPPRVALVPAFSFGSYGPAKKQANVRPVESLTIETLVLAPIAVGYLVLLAVTGAASFGNHGTGHALLFTTTGIVTAIPLILFGAAAIRVPLVALGLLQYLAPIIQFGLGRPALPRGHAHRPLDRLRARVGGAGALHGRDDQPPPASAEVGHRGVGLLIARPAAPPFGRTAIRRRTTCGQWSSGGA